ncbi:MAG: beta-galactosidase [Elusimicrobiales bacterium]|nr:beta-galactosidase [Elusimicrobiales bacterium]
MKSLTTPEMRGGNFILNGKPTFIYSGEFHYFRCDPKDWADRLARAKEAGLNAVASYIPWRWHEVKEGVFDFTGRTHPRRNLLEFMRLVKESGLYFIPRIGPVSNGEMMNEGLPDWLSEKYPEVFLPANEGKTIHHQSPPAYNSPRFLARVRAWYQKLVPLLTAAQYPAGNIPFFQLCNEIGMINWLGKIGDYAPYSDRMYRDFLKKKYAGIGKLNAAYKTAYKGFPEIKQPSNILVEENLRRLLDWGDYYKEYYAVYFAKLHAMARKLGVRTPVLANIPQFYDYDLRGRGIYSPATTIKFGGFAEKVPGVIFGGAYQMRRLDYENFHDIPITTAVVRSITPEGSPVICAELQTGVLSDKPRLYPADVELNLRTTLMSGVNGLNCYMFAGGTNEGNVGQFGLYHEWQAPVASDGRLRGHYKSLKGFGDFVNGLGAGAAAMPPAADLHLGFYNGYYNTEYLDGPMADRMFAVRNEFFFDGLARQAYLTGYQTGLTDIQKSPVIKAPALAVFSTLFMDAASQKKLFSYVEKGGRLLFCGETLLADEGWKPCPVFLDSLGLTAEKVKRVRTIDFLGRETYLHNQDINTFGGLLPDDKVIALYKGRPCGIVRKVGKGTLCLLGFHFSDKFDYFKPAFDAVCRELGVKKSVSTGGYDLVTMLRRDKESGFLLVANYHDDVMPGLVTADFDGDKIELPVLMRNRAAVIVPLHYKLKTGATIRYATCEITSIAYTDRGLELAYNTASAETDLIAFTGLSVSSVAAEGGEVAVSARSNGATLKLRRKPGCTAGKVSIYY